MLGNTFKIALGIGGTLLVGQFLNGIVENAFKNTNDFEQTYLNHAEFYSEYKKHSYFIKNITDKLKRGSHIEAFRLKGPRNKLTSVIHVILELIADREFSCNFTEYGINDVREMQNALAILWGIGESKNQKMDTVNF